MSDQPLISEVAPGAAAPAAEVPALGGFVPAIPVLDVDSMSAAQRRDYITKFTAVMTKQHPLMDGAHPGHKAAVEIWTKLHADPGGVAPAVAAEPGIGFGMAVAVATNTMVWAGVRNDGVELTREDVAESNINLANTITTLGLSRAEAGNFAFVLNGAMQAGRRDVSSPEAAQAELVTRLGLEGAMTAGADARRVIAHLEKAGIPAGEALRRSGAGNNVSLILQLAKMAARIS